MCRSWMNECEKGRGGGIKVNKETRIKFFFLTVCACVSRSFSLSLALFYDLSFFFLFFGLSMYAQCRSFITFEMMKIRGRVQVWDITRSKLDICSSRCDHLNDRCSNVRFLFSIVWLENSTQLWLVVESSKKRMCDWFPLDCFLPSSLDSSIHTTSAGWVEEIRYSLSLSLLPLVRSFAHFFDRIKMQICVRGRRNAQLVLCANFSLSLVFFLSVSRFMMKKKKKRELEEKSFYSSPLVFINQTDFDLFE